MNAIIFDFDGTIADTAPGIVHTMKATFLRMGKPVPTEEAMRQTIGIPLGKALQMLNNLTEEETKTAVETYSELFMTHEVGRTTIFPNVFETLSYFKNKGIKMAIATSRNVESLEIILEKNNLSGFFEQMVTNNDHLTPKPAPDMVLTLLDRMGISEKETLVVGDTTFDIMMGNRANCHTCAVTYGNHTRKQLATAKPDYIINSFDELIKIV